VKRKAFQIAGFVAAIVSKRGRRDFKLTSYEKVANLISEATKKARELLNEKGDGGILN
jgi:hypothetical protein